MASSISWEKESSRGHGDAVEPHLEPGGFQPFVEAPDEWLVIGAGVGEEETSWHRWVSDGHGAGPESDDTVFFGSLRLGKSEFTAC